MPLVLLLHLVMMNKYSKFGVDTFNTFWVMGYIKVFAWQQQWRRSSYHNSLTFSSKQTSFFLRNRQANNDWILTLYTPPHNNLLIMVKASSYLFVLGTPSVINDTCFHWLTYLCFNHSTWLFGGRLMFYNTFLWSTNPYRKTYTEHLRTSWHVSTINKLSDNPSSKRNKQFMAMATINLLKVETWKLSSTQIWKYTKLNIYWWNGLKHSSGIPENLLILNQLKI